MALIKSKQDRRDITISYWRVIEVNKCEISDTDKRSHCVIAGWPDKAASKKYPASPHESYSYDWAGIDYPFSLGELNKPDMNDKKIFYLELHKPKQNQDGEETNWFADAVDDI